MTVKPHYVLNIKYDRKEIGLLSKTKCMHYFFVILSFFLALAPQRKESAQRIPPKPADLEYASVTWWETLSIFQTGIKSDLKLFPFYMRITFWLFRKSLQSSLDWLCHNLLMFFKWFICFCVCHSSCCLCCWSLYSVQSILMIPSTCLIPR